MSKPYQVFCTIPGHETTSEHDTFEQAFRAHYALMNPLLDEIIDFDRIDKGVGIIDHGTTILAPQVNERAIRIGLMDIVLMEIQPNEVELSLEAAGEILESLGDAELQALADKAECDNLVANYPPPVAHDLILSGRV